MTTPRRDDPFPGVFDDEFPVGAQDGNRAYFGRDVLRGLVDGIKDFEQRRQERWWHPGSRTIGPALLGCSPWINDDALLSAIETLKGACVVTTKQPRTANESRVAERLRAFNARTPGFQLRALNLGDMAPKVDGEPLVAGPSTPIDVDFTVTTIRTIGRRQTDARLPPLAHAKLAVLGYLRWHDEDALGHPDDILGFAPRRLWVSSANFTYGSRRSLEFGYWTEEPALVDRSKHFLARLVGASEGLDADSDAPDPDLAPIEFDWEAIAEMAAEMAWEEDEEDEP